jgi:arylformamidase
MARFPDAVRTLITERTLLDGAREAVLARGGIKTVIDLAKRVRGGRMASPWIDVSATLRTGMVTWPGDPAVRISQALSMERGDPCTVSQLELGAHTGTHMDAPAHFVRGGAGIDEMPLDTAIGRARVIAITDPESIKPAELAAYGIGRGERVLFKTRNSERPWDTSDFMEDFVCLSAPAARYLAERQVGLVGIDYLSVGGFQADGEETHHILLEAGIWVVEGLCLDQAPSGPVELVCLPLKIAGGDGAPARVLVRQTE